MKENATSKRIISSALIGISALLSVIFAATHDFVPDVVFKGSSLAGWRSLGHADWRADNGEVIGTPKDQDGGWLIFDKSWQDVQFYTEFRCSAQCDAGASVDGIADW